MYIILCTKGPPTLGKKLVVKVPDICLQVKLLPNTSCIDVLVSSSIISWAYHEELKREYMEMFILAKYLALRVS